MAERYLLENKVAIVTGGGAGIGRAVVSEFAKERAKVVIAELRPDHHPRRSAEF